MCQMPNIWHIWHTKHQKPLLSDVPNLIKFATCEQYCCKFAMVRTKNSIWVNNFLFSFLSPLSSLYSFLFSLTYVLSHRFPLSYLCSSHRFLSIFHPLKPPPPPISPIVRLAQPPLFLSPLFLRSTRKLGSSTRLC